MKQRNKKKVSLLLLLIKLKRILKKRKALNMLMMKLINST